MTTSTLRRPQISSSLVVAAGAGVASLLIGALLPLGSLARLGLAAAVAFLLIAVGLRSPRLLLYSLLVWLPVLGLLRRLVTTLGSAGPLGDPLLLVAPAAWILLAAVAVSRGALHDRTPLSTAVLVLTGLLTASVVNPLQGGLTVGLAGLLLVVPPMLAFWVGRSLLDERTFVVVIRLLAAMAIPAAGYGLVQTLAGFPDWDNRWIHNGGYTALNVGRGVLRPFSSFSSGSEYAAFLAVGIIAWLAIALRRGIGSKAVGASSFILLAVALWYESARTAVVLAVAASWFIFAARRRLSLRLALIGGAILISALPWLVGHLAPEQFGSAPTSALSSHQVQGLSDPLAQNSTLHAHVNETIAGIKGAFTNPLGHGVGAVTIAADKYSGAAAGTEADPGNAGQAAGVIGLAAYAFVLAYGLVGAYRNANTGYDLAAVAALGILVATLFQWLTGGQYAVAALPWLALGWVDRQRSMIRTQV